MNIFNFVWSKNTLNKGKNEDNQKNSIEFSLNFVLLAVQETLCYTLTI